MIPLAEPPETTALPLVDFTGSDEIRRTVTDKLNVLPFFVEHRLGDHPLFALDRLVELCRMLPEDRVEYNAGDLPVSVDPDQTPQNGLSPDETIRRIAECSSWLVLKNVECDPAYGALLRECLAPLRQWAPDLRGEEGFVFVSSPGSVTPYHIDPECNFLLQVRGTKTVRMYDGRDRDLLTEPELERFYAGAARNLKLAGSAAEPWTFELPAGRGLHFPVTYPHWVKNGPEVSVSFSVTFRTDASDRREVLYRMHHRLRRLGLKPAPIGTAPRREAMQYGAFRGLRAVKKAAGGRS